MVIENDLGRASQLAITGGFHAEGRGDSEQVEHDRGRGWFRLRRPGGGRQDVGGVGAGGKLGAEHHQAAVTNLKRSHVAGLQEKDSFKLSLNDGRGGQCKQVPQIRRAGGEPLRPDQGAGPPRGSPEPG